MLAVIPARGGSKGIKNKNIVELDGKPLIAYTIESAIEAGVFDKVIVSTDSEEIARIAEKYGAEIPFLRPDDISGDAISSDAVLLHAIDYFEGRNIRFDAICKLQPTSPLRTKDDIRGAYSLLKATRKEFVVSVCECEHSPLWSGRLDNDGGMNSFVKDEVIISCRQLLEKYYRLNGAIYMATYDGFMREKSFFCTNSTIAYIMQQNHSVDIDSEMDLKIAEVYLRNNRNA